LALDLKVNRALAPFGERLERRAPQDRVDAVAHLAPYGAHRTRVAALARRVAVLLETFDRSEVTLYDLHDVGHGDLCGMPREQIAAAWPLLTGDETATFELDQQSSQVVLGDTLGSGDFLDAQ